MRKMILAAAIAVVCAMCVMIQPAAAQEQPQRSNRIERLEFFKQKLYENPFNMSVVAGSYIVVQDICNTPTWDDIRQAQDIVSVMFAAIGDADPVQDAQKNIIERQGDALIKIGQELNEAAKNYRNSTACQDDHKTSPKVVVHLPDGSSGPLMIVDGKECPVPCDIKPEDIKSIEVLKDMGSKEKYGERGANGVMLITTKMSEIK